MTMQATAATPIRIHERIWHDIDSPLEPVSIKPLIELAITETMAQAGFVYRFDPENQNGSLVLSLGQMPASSVSESADLDSRTLAFHWNRPTPVVLHQDAASDWRFGVLSEFRRGKFQAVVSVPLVDRAAVVGMANFCRKEAEPWRARDVAFFVSLSLPLGAVISTATLKSELARTSQKLADRKILDRAKGLLQSRLGWSEEEAYFQVRRLSRQRRIPMREVAREIIEAGTGGSLNVEVLGG
jgi:GAF domain-containing protein